MNTINNKVILLTGCINPNGMAKTVLQDPRIRKQQYISAISYYLSNTQLPIVFVENSNTDISHEFQKEVHDGRIEFVVFNGNDFDKRRGKGYGEAIIIEYALKHSRIMAGADIIIKITGRLLCININMIQKISHPKTVTACVVNVIVDGRIRNACKSQVFAVPQDFLNEYFLSRKEELNDTKHYYFEHLLWDSIQQWKACGGKFREFFFLPILQGQSGSTGTIYKTSLFFRVLHPLKVLIHQVFHYYGTLNPNVIISNIRNSNKNNR